MVRCVWCGGVIGIYEPLVAVENERARTISVAAEPKLSTAEGLRYHGDCHAGAQPSGTGSQST